MNYYKNLNALYLIIFIYCSIIGMKLNANEENRLEWEIIRSKNLKDIEETIKWEIIQESKEIKNKDNTKTKKRIKEQLKGSNNNLNQLGKSIPTANTLSKGELKLETSHVSTFGEGMSGGTGNQNYSGLIQYGLTENISISTFYTEADDPLFRKIIDKEIHPENLWINYGIGMRWKIINKDKLKGSIDSSIENWRVGSGGCFGFNCNTKSSNIFNSELHKVENVNFITSISAPLSWNLFRKTKLLFVPRFINLPSHQENKSGQGKFYGFNYGLGLGLEHIINNKIITYISTYMPINSTNSFDENLVYKGENIYTLGMNYLIDKQTHLEGYITNSFGQTPSTSILTIPSANTILFGGNLTYRPKRFIYNQKNQDNQSLFRNKNNVKKLKSRESPNNLKIGINNQGDHIEKLNIRLSKLFTFHLSSEIITQNEYIKNKIAKQFILPNTLTIRGGGTVVILPKIKEKAFSHLLRITVGRALGEKRPGYLFAELPTEYDISKNIKGSVSPRIAWTGSGSIIGIGSKLNWTIDSDIEIIPAVNMNISNGDNTIGISAKKNITPKASIEVNLSNSLGRLDMSELVQSKSTKYGAYFTYTF